MTKCLTSRHALCFVNSYSYHRAMVVKQIKSKTPTQHMVFCDAEQQRVLHVSFSLQPGEI